MSPVRDRVTEAVSQAADMADTVGGRLTGALRRRVRTVRERAARQEAAASGQSLVPPTADPRVAALAFGGGYLVRSLAVPPPPVVAGWPTRTLGDRAYHARTPMTYSMTSAGQAVVLLGYPVDVDAGLSDAQAIADRLAEVADGRTAHAGTVHADTAHAGTGDPHDAVQRAAAYLGGRWTLFLQDADGGLMVLPDALASQPVWHSPDGAVIGSHEALVTKGAVLPVNSVLEVTSGHDVRVRDLHLDDGTGSESAGATYEQFRERLVAHTHLLTETGLAGVALTAGPASHAVLAAHLPHHTQDDFAFTNFATDSAREGRGPAMDLFGASALAHRLGIAHRVVRAVDPPAGSVFEAAYQSTWPNGDSIATAYARHQLPPDTVELHSTGAQTHDVASWQAVPDEVRDGDLSHRVALPFNDRRLLDMLCSQPSGQSFVARLAEELPPGE